MAYRPRRLKQAKTPMSEVAWRYFMAPRGTCDDYEESSSKSAAEEGAARDDFLGLYYLNDWQEYWRGHRAAIEAEWLRRFPDPEERVAHRRWALQSFSERLRDRFTAERDNAFADCEEDQSEADPAGLCDLNFVDVKKRPANGPAAENPRDLKPPRGRSEKEKEKHNEDDGISETQSPI